MLLFSLGFGCAFPVDVWVRRALSGYMGEAVTQGSAARFARERFGENAGLMQQYLFFYEREHA